MKNAVLPFLKGVMALGLKFFFCTIYFLNALEGGGILMKLSTKKESNV
jgi:hypothetical protein